METLRLSKHHALRNDFLILLLTAQEKAALDALHIDWPGVTERVCDRHRGVGADGLIVAAETSAAQPNSAPDALEANSAPQTRHVQMRLFNSDGSSAEVSGNGLACLVHEVARGLLPSMEFDDGVESSDHVLELVVDTEGGERRMTLDAEFDGDANGSLVLVEPIARVRMPRVVPGPTITAELDEQISESFGSTPRGTGDVGNPHLVIYTGRPMDADETARLGAAYETHFPDGINVEFIWRSGHEDPNSASPRSLGMRVWERGAGLTQACGTGAITAAVLARDWGLVEPHSETIVEMPGGEATILTDGDKPPVLSVPVAHLGDSEWQLHATSLDADG